VAILCYTGAVFSGCLICHGLLHALRPTPQRLTRFYLLMGLGGALGGWGGAIAAPLIFDRLYEFPIAAAMVALCSLIYFRHSIQKRLRWALAPSVILMSAAALTLCLTAMAPGYHMRDFFGTIVVRAASFPNGRFRTLRHGNTTHGIQIEDHPEIPVSYYSKGSPLGQVMALQRLRKPALRIGIVGLGAGSAAAYGQNGDNLRIYEISPNVVELAGRNGSTFSAVKNSPAQVVTVLGDGRRVLGEELLVGSQQFDVLLVDAFSGDQIPWHLLTQEALSTFLGHLAPDGILAFHVSNPLPINRLLAANIKALDKWGLELNHTYIDPQNPYKALIQRSIYVLIAKDQALVQQDLFRLAAWVVLPVRPGLPIGPKGMEKAELGQRAAQVTAWTDNRNSLSPLLWMKPFP